MNKKLISLFAASAMIATASVGLVQTAYAVDPNVRIEVADGATDTQKILTFYYDCDLGMNALQGTLTFSSDEVTIDTVAITIGAKYTGADKDSGVFYFAEEEDGGASSADGSFATATITVPATTDSDIYAYFEVEAFEDADFEPHEEEIGTVSAVVKAAPVGPVHESAAVKSAEKKASYDGLEAYAEQKADVYGVEIEMNDDVVTGASVYFDDEHQGTVNFGGKFTGGTAVFALILASESGAELPSLDNATITPILAE